MAHIFNGRVSRGNSPLFPAHGYDKKQHNKATQAIPLLAFPPAKPPASSAFSFPAAFYFPETKK